MTRNRIASFALGVFLSVPLAAVGDGLSFDPSHLTNPTVSGSYTQVDTVTNFGAAFNTTIAHSMTFDANPLVAPGVTFGYGSLSKLETRAGNNENYYLLVGGAHAAGNYGNGNVSSMQGSIASAYWDGPGTATVLTGAGISAGTNQGTATSIIGLTTDAYVYGTSSSTTATSLHVGAADVENTATLGTHRSIYIDAPYKDPGATITNNYGIYIEDQSGVGGTIARNFHSAGAGSNNRFDGAVSIGGALTLSTALPATSGGTGIASYAVGDLLYANTTTTLAKLADVAAGSYLRSGGVNTAPVWSTLVLPNSSTSGGVLYSSAANTVASSGVLAANTLTKGGGAGAAPVDSQITDNGTTITLPGTNVNITATNLQRNGNNVQTVRTFTGTINPASLAAATTRTDTETMTGISATGGAVTCYAGTDPTTTQAQCVVVNLRPATNQIIITWRNTLDAVTACDVPSSTWTCSQPQ